MSKKKQQKNGFFYYMLDMQQDFKQQGRIVPMRDMPIFAGPSWSKLSDAQKHKYNIRAKSSKNSPQAQAIGETGKRDCSGRLVSERPDVEKEMLEKRRRESEAIHAMLPAGKRATLEDIWVMDIQSLCHIPQKPDCMYLPCEIGVLRYSLNQGVLSKYHKFIRPGSIPIGYRYLAQSTSDATNQIPMTGVEGAEGDYRGLLGELEQFLTRDGASAIIPPIFAKREFVERVEWSLQWLADVAGVTNRITRVYEIENLIDQLVLHSDGEKTISPFRVQDFLNTSNYEHDSNARCDYHEELDSIHCSLGIVHTYCYVLSELLCPLFGINLSRRHLAVVPPAPQKRSSSSSSGSGSVGLRGPPRSVGRGSMGRGAGIAPTGRGGGLGRGTASPPKVRQPLPLGRGFVLTTPEHSIT